MINWSVFEAKYGAGAWKAFEDLCNCLFCKQLGIINGLISRINQPDIETDPVRIGDELIGFQVKYYGPSIRISQKEKELSAEILSAANRYKGISKIYLYINKVLSSNPNNEFAIPNFQSRIDNQAKEVGISIDWFDISRIESLLREPQYRYIYAYYFNNDTILPKELLNYYSYVEGLYTLPDKEKQLVGSYSLSESFIDPYFIDGRNDRELVIKELENWCISSKNGICIIHGQPGHGKTSLCIHAVSGFFRDVFFQKYDYQAVGSKLTGNTGKTAVHIGTIVKNVFWFSLNPLIVKDIIDRINKSLNLHGAFCWGVEGENKYFQNNINELNNSLVFLDGYDELMFMAAQITKTRHLRDFIIKVNEYAVTYNIHFVITARSASIENELLSLPEDIDIRIMRLDSVSKEQQEVWMRQHNIKEEYIEYILSIENRDMQKLLGIPILFKMIVNYELKDLINENTVSLYKRLFEKTMERHRIPEDDRDEYHKELEKIAYKMFCSNKQVVNLAENTITSVGYTYYIEVENILGFYHRSFYQYFISHCIYEKLKSINDEKTAEEFLKLICRSIIDTEILNKILEWSRIEKCSTNAQLEKLLNRIDSTDAIFVINDTDSDVNRFTLCNYAFYNAISLTNKLSYRLSVEKHHRTCNLLRWYDMRNMMLNNATLNNLSFSRVNWEGAVITYSQLNYTNLSYAFLKSVIFTRSNFNHSYLVRAVLRDVTMINAKLSDTSISEADFTGADLSKTIFDSSYCDSAIFKYSTLAYTEFKDIKLTNVDFSYSHASEATFENCNLPQSNFSRANLAGVKFIKSTLSSVNFNRSNLLGANFLYAKLIDISFKGVYAVEAQFNKTNIMRGMFQYADLRGASFSGTYIKESDFSGSDIRGIKIVDSVIINSIFDTGKESDYYGDYNYYTRTKIDDKAEWRNTQVYVDFQDKKFDKTIQFFKRIGVEVNDLNKSDKFVE